MKKFLIVLVCLLTLVLGLGLAYKFTDGFGTKHVKLTAEDMEYSEESKTYTYDLTEEFKEYPFGAEKLTVLLNDEEYELILVDGATEDNQKWQSEKEEFVAVLVKTKEGTEFTLTVKVELEDEDVIKINKKAYATFPEVEDEKEDNKEDTAGDTVGGNDNVTDEPSEPTEPEDPTESEDPTEPSEPTEPEDPTEPSEPTEPEEPVVDYDIKVGDAFNALVMDTTVTPDFDAFDWTNAKVYSHPNPEESLLHGMEYVELFAFTQGDLELTFDAFRGTLEGQSFFALVHGKDGVFYVAQGEEFVGWVESSYVFEEEMNITAVYQQEVWAEYIAGETRELVNYTNIAVGDSIEKIAFNDSKMNEEMEMYLSSLTYDLEINGVESVCKLMSIDETEDYDVGVYAMNFNAFADTMGTRGYGIAIIDDTGEGFILLQGVYATAYSEANVALINAIKAEGYELKYTNLGWCDVEDYYLTEGEHTIVFVIDDFVTEFILK